MDMDWLNKYYPIRSVTITNREPEFVTPGIKYLLRRKNKLMRKNKIEEAGAVAEQIGKAITRANKADLRKVSHSGNTKALWDKVKVYSKGRSTMEQHNTITAEVLNAHYATISTDPEYKEPPLRQTVERPHQLVNEQVIFHSLHNLKATAEGIDQLPWWYLRLTAPVFSKPLAHVINILVAAGHVPTQWKMALIIPIPKVHTPTLPSDYRPLSIVPILSRLVERGIGRYYPYPEFTRHPLSDYLNEQYAFRPTGSTTAAPDRLYCSCSC